MARRSDPTPRPRPKNKVPMRWALGLKRGTECRSYRPCLGIAHQTVRRFLHIHLTVHDSQQLWLGEALSLRKRDRWRAAVPGRRQANPKQATRPCLLENPRQAAPSITLLSAWFQIHPNPIPVPVADIAGLAPLTPAKAAGPPRLLFARVRERPKSTSLLVGSKACPPACGSPADNRCCFVAGTATLPHQTEFYSEAGSSATPSPTR